MHRVIVVSSPSFSGGGIRALRALKAYSKVFETYLFLTPEFKDLISSNLKTLFVAVLKELEAEGIQVIGYSSMQKLPLNNILNKILRIRLRAVREILPLQINLVGRKWSLEPDIVVTHHEYYTGLCTAIRLAEIFNVKSLALLQLPPFYGSKARRKKIYAAHKLWINVQYHNNFIRKYLTPCYNMISDRNRIHKHREILRKFSKIVAVSKAIPKEMGGVWERRVIPLNPGVSLDDEDVQLINSLRMAKSSEKRNYIVFGGRPVASKGLIEGLMAFKLISKSFPNLRMIVTGNIDDVTSVNLNRFCRSIGIKNKVVFTGFLPRVDRFEIVSKSILMLYPSHVDAFPYAVCESLYLGTPVVAYKIPALEIYYGDLNGVKLVEEGDFEALAKEAINVLTNKVEVEIPKIKSWDEIMCEEIALIREAIQT